MLIRHSEPNLRSPVLLAAFRGWNDAGDAATFAATHIEATLGGQRFASIDPEEFYDFQENRPQVELVDGFTRRISWPANDFYAVELPGAPNDLIVFIGTEPSLRWRTFAGMVVDVAKGFGTELVITLGALLADIPHSRPVHVTGTAADQELIERLGLIRSRYEGPTGIVGVLHDACAHAGLGSASLWAAVPHYLAVSPNPKAALALVERATQLIGASVDIGPLVAATTTYEERVDALVAGDEDIQRYVALLEERADERWREEQIADLPSADAIAAEVERFLKEQ